MDIMMAHTTEILAALLAVSEVLALIPDGKRLVIEIKCGVEGLPELERDLKASGKPAAQLVIISFHHDVCAQAKQLFPQIPVLFLASFKQDKASGKWTPTPESLTPQAAAELAGAGGGVLIGAALLLVALGEGGVLVRQRLHAGVALARLCGKPCAAIGDAIEDH